MFSFLILFTVLTVTLANPIQQNFDNLNLNSNTDLSDSTTIKNSIDSADPGCSSSTSMNNELDGGIQKRFKVKENVCPATIDTPSTQKQPPIEVPHKSTNHDDPCEEPFPNYISCGDMEFIDPEEPSLIAVVFNCGPGGFSYILLVYS